MEKPVDCVGIVCIKPDTQEVLLIQRGQPPRLGEWSVPGGRINPNESEREAAARELLEETGVKAEIIDKIETIDAKFENHHYLLHDYVALWTSGRERAGDDAINAKFVPLDQITSLGMWNETIRIILKAQRMFETGENSNSL